MRPCRLTISHLVAVALALGAANLDLHAAIVVENTNVQWQPSFDDPSSYNYRATISTTVVPGLDDTFSDWLFANNILKNAGGLINYLQGWYVVQPGDPLTSAAWFTGQYPNAHNAPVTDGSDFYLGVIVAPVTGSPEPPPTTFGWVQLRPQGDTLTMIANVMSYDSTGIIVGTTRLVPEPAALPIAASILLSTAAVGRRKPLN